MRQSTLDVPIGLLLTGALLAGTGLGCGRTMVFFPASGSTSGSAVAPPVATCDLTVAPSALAFGSLAPGVSASLSTTLTSTGTAACELDDIAIADGGNPAFTLPAAQPSTATLEPGQTLQLAVDFSPSQEAAAGPVSAILTFASNDPNHPIVDVPLTATLGSGCTLLAQPTSLDFGLVPLFASASQTVTISSVGDLTCPVSALGLAPGSDPFFSLPVPGLAPTTLPPGQSLAIPVAFQATDGNAPHTRTGTLVITSGSETLSVPLTAETPLGCSLTALPDPLTFGNVGLNQSITEQVTVTNQGTLPCTVSSVALTPPIDPLFTLAPVSPFVIAAGQASTLAVTFDAAVSTPPYLHNGMLSFDSTDPQNPTFEIPLSAFVSTACTLASQWIYTVDTAGNLAQFNPATLAFTPVGPLNCPDSSSPFSMAVDQNAVAWVEYMDGNLFQVSTTTAACTPTTFQPDQDGVDTFGMGFVFDPNTGIDTLYVAGGPSNPETNSTLATIAFPSLVLSPVAPLTFGSPELSGTGDGQLWGFVPSEYSATGVSTLAQIDTATGDVIQSFPYPNLPNGNFNFAMKFWGGSFWIFLGNSVYEVPRATGVLTTAIDGTAPAVVGAGVSTCAPVQ